jgi:hypothetical protein
LPRAQRGEEFGVALLDGSLECAAEFLDARSEPSGSGQ